MASFVRSFTALVWRNVIYRRRRWISSIFDFVLPILFMLLLVWIKILVEDTESFRTTTVPAYFPSNADTVLPLSFNDYLTALQAKRICQVSPNGSSKNVTGMDSAFSSPWPVPFVLCDTRQCEANGQDALPFCEYRILGIAPSENRQEINDGVDQFVSWILDSYPVIANNTAFPFAFDLVQTFPSSADIDAYVRSANYGTSMAPKLGGAIVLSSSFSDDEKRWKYTLRVNSTNFNNPELQGRPNTRTTPDTSKLLDAYAKNPAETCKIQDGGPNLGRLGASCTGQYILNGAVVLQRLVDDWILNISGAKEAGNHVSESGVAFVNFPSKEYLQQGFYAYIAPFAPLLLILGLIYPIANFIRMMVSEKELRQKELMKMMSVSDAAIEWSWFFTNFIFLAASAAATAYASTFFYEKSDFTLLLIYWQLVFLASLMFANVMAAFSSKSTRATLVGVLNYFVGYFLAIAFDYNTLRIWITLLLSFHPVTAFSFGLQVIGDLEDKGVGLTWDTISFADSPSGYSLLHSAGSLAVDIISCGVLSWYLNRVVKGDYGSAQPFYFPLSPSYWCPGQRSRTSSVADEGDRATYDPTVPIESVSDALKEQEKDGKSIEIHALTKTFGSNTAVDGLTLSMYSGQVTALLGHNGAGKTTTIGMLTGLIEPSAGHAVIAGKDARTQMHQVRQDVGICLQHDCLFPLLTVKEHLQFFSSVKGMYKTKTRREAEASIITALEDVALLEKRNTLSKKLSGGMKRKLSVAIAFCGGSKVVFLDEPTSGMDPFSRRFTWNVIRQYRRNRCIVLTTHFMDEADLLGDRIAIMAEGRLRCVGSSLFLKKTYGVGYQLTIEKGKRNVASVCSYESSGVSSTASCVSEAASSKVSAHMLETEKSSEPNLLDTLIVGQVSKVEDGEGIQLTLGDRPTVNEGTTLESHSHQSDKNEAQSECSRHELMRDGSIDIAIADDVMKVQDNLVRPEDIERSLEDIVLSFVKRGKLLSNVGSEMSFQLPLESSGNFVQMFNELDKQVQVGNAVTYGVSVTTLEEVFLMIARGEAPHRSDQTVHKGLKSSEVAASSQNSVSTEETSSSGSSRAQNDQEATSAASINAEEFNELSDGALFRRHVQALFAKRALNFKRDKRAWFCSTILPSILAVFGFLIVSLTAADTKMKALTLSLSQNNAGITSVKNPIPYNPPGKFHCTPGFCPLSSSEVKVDATGESYYFCGASATLKEYADSCDGTYCGANCSVFQQDDIVGSVSEVTPVAVIDGVHSVQESSFAVVETASTFEASQYGALFFSRDMNSLVKGGGLYNESAIQSCKQDPGNYRTTDQCNGFGGIAYVVSTNFTSLHAALLYQAVADEMIMNEALQSKERERSISVTVDPLPITALEETFSKAEDSFTAWFVLVFSFPFITGAFATFIVAERMSKSKHLQTVSGVKPSAYWIASYIWDIINYQFPMWIVVLLMVGFDNESFVTTERDALAGTVATLFLFGPAAAGFTYCVTFLFDNPSRCNFIVIVSNFLVGLAGPLVCLILKVIGGNPARIADIVVWFLRPLPAFNLGKSLLFIINAAALEGLAGGTPLSVFSPEILLYELIFQAAGSIVYLCLAIMLDHLSTNPHASSMWHKFVGCVTLRALRRKRSAVNRTGDSRYVSPSKDSDVAAEEERVLSGAASGELIVIKELTKEYNNQKLAVDSLSLGIPAGECFGLLGVNGAGKTTTMSMLTAEFPPTSGDALLCGSSVTHAPERTRRKLGYCPQFDAHFANMTGQEHVELYACIKGLPAKSVKTAAARKLMEVGLSEYDSSRLSGGYSGGMKRKLSVACATIGDPNVVLLDEPSTGMDPVARRDMWGVISKMVKKHDVSVVLTTHSMEECEALCPRIAIMAGGRLRCIGSAQHLKSKFGKGYQVELKISAPASLDDDYQCTVKSLLDKPLKALGKAAPPDADVYGLEDVEYGVIVHEHFPTSLISLLAQETFLNLAQAQRAVSDLTGDDSISYLISPCDPSGYVVYKAATSEIGVSADELAMFCVSELRVRRVLDFMEREYAGDAVILRERQDSKLRFEIGSRGVRISSIFASIEDNKSELKLAEYGVSQTSLEQVFNMHAAEAEQEKQGTVD